MRRHLQTLLTSAILLAAYSCSDDSAPLTQVMVVVDSDMAQIDSVRVRIEGMGDPRIATASDLEKHPLPRTVAIVHTGGPLGPIEVTAEALAGDSTLVSRRAQISFVRGRNLMLALELEQSCVGMKCEKNQTCIAGACESQAVDAAELSDWSGKPPAHRDAGMSGADAGSAGEGAGSGGSTGSGGRSGAGGKPAGQGGGGSGGQTAGMGGKPAAGSGGSPPLNCSGCTFDPGTTSHGQLSCDSGNGVCTLSCDQGYIDADRAFGNGCEEQMSTFPWKASNLDPKSSMLTAAIAPGLSIDCTATLDLGSGALPSSVEICSQQLQPVLIPQGAGAPDLVVLAMRHLSVVTGSNLRITGSLPVALVVFGDAEIEGELDVSAVGSTGGAGSNFECNPGIGGDGDSSGDISDPSGGGGGGGFGTKGGDGADSTPSGAQGATGGLVSSDPTLVPLRGGCAGGRGGLTRSESAAGGAGGGALQISVAGKLHIGGTIAAVGGGGLAGVSSGDGGGGGGSGGAILLEATTLETVSGAWLSASGGGGGGGRAISTPTAGSDGAHASANVASGGSGVSAGGNGAAGGTVAAGGPSCSYSWCGGGGGGGGLGRIVLRSAECQLAGSATPTTVCSAHPN